MPTLAATNTLHTYVQPQDLVNQLADLLRSAPRPVPSNQKNPSGFKTIYQYTFEELDSAIKEAEQHMGLRNFYIVLRGIYSYRERRRRLGHTIGPKILEDKIKRLEKAIGFDHDL